MALIGTIRKNFWFVLILLGFALAAFIVMDMTSAGNAGGSTNPSLGRIAGQNISYSEFSQSESGLFQGSSNTFANRKNLWDFYVEKAIVDSEANSLGLGVSKAELAELQFGPNYSPLISQQLQSGQMSFQQLNEIKTAIETEQFTNPQYRDYWSELQKQIMKAQKQGKISNLVSKAVYTPNWMAEEDFVTNNSSTDFAFVKIQADAYTDPVEINDQDISNFINKNKSTYTRKAETRNIEYVSFDVIPTEADKKGISDGLANQISALQNTENDSLYAVTHNGSVQNIYFSKDQLPEGAQDQIANLPVGGVYGPFETNGVYSLVKKVDQRVVADSVSARHILKRVAPGDVAGLIAANAAIDSLKSRYDRGYESFDSLAIKNSDDGSAASGGELGTFVQGAMVPAFNDVCFLSGKAGRGVYKTTSNFGVHLIKIDDQKFLNRDPKYKVVTVNEAVVPSKETQDLAYDKVANILSENKTYESLKAVVDSDPELSFEPGGDLESDAFAVGKLDADNTARDIVKWAYNPSTEVGDVSPEIYTFQDRVNYTDSKYVLASLKAIVPKGLLSVDNARERLTTLVTNAKKADLIAAQINSTDLSAIAAQWGGKVDTVRNVNPGAGFVQGLGAEAKVIGAANGLELNAVSKPILGTSGVFVVSPIAKKPAGAPVNIPAMRNTNQQAARQTMLSKLVDAWKAKAKIEDNRGTYF